MTSRPQVSVLMPAYNSEPFVREAVASILAQTLSSFELIVIDDGSTDQTCKILEELAQTDPRVIVYSRPNQGVVSTRNELLALARAELIAWVDSDDTCESNRLQLQAECFTGNPSLVSVGSSLLYVDPKGRPLWVQTFPERLTIDRHLQSPQTDTPFGASMMRTQAVRDVGGFREPFPIGEDFDLLLRLIEIGEIWNLKETLYHYRQHPHSITSAGQLGSDWLQYYTLIHELALDRRHTGSDSLQRGEQIPAIEKAVENHRIELSDSIQHAIWARQAKLHGFFRSAVIHAWISICQSPFSAIGWRAMARVLLRHS